MHGVSFGMILILLDLLQPRFLHLYIFGRHLEDSDTSRMFLLPLQSWFSITSNLRVNEKCSSEILNKPLI